MQQWNILTTINSFWRCILFWPPTLSWDIVAYQELHFEEREKYVDPFFYLFTRLLPPESTQCEGLQNSLSLKGSLGPCCHRDCSRCSSVSPAMIASDRPACARTVCVYKQVELVTDWGCMFTGWASAKRNQEESRAKSWSHCVQMKWSAVFLSSGQHNCNLTDEQISIFVSQHCVSSIFKKTLQIETLSLWIYLYVYIYTSIFNIYCWMKFKKRNKLVM